MTHIDMTFHPILPKVGKIINLTHFVGLMIHLTHRLEHMTLRLK